MKILAIDNNRGNLKALSAIIREALPAAVVVTAENGPEAVELARAEDPDVILLDIGMTGMDAFQVCRRLKADERLVGIPVVFLTATSTSTAGRAQALDVGAEGFLARPLEPVELTAQIRAMVKVKAAARMRETATQHLETAVSDRTHELEHHLDEVHKLADDWQTTFDSVKDAIWILDRDMRVVRSNNTATSIFGYRPGDVLGKQCWQVVHDTSEPISECPVLRMRRSLQRETTDLKIGDRWVEVTVDPVVDSAGGLAGAVHIMTDITGRKRAEEKTAASESRFRAIFESANVGKSLTSVTGEINVNEAFCKMLGYSPDELKDRKWQELTPQEEIPAVTEYLRPLLDGELDATRFTKRYIHKDGSFVWADVSTSLRRDGEGKPLHFITTVVDITNRVRAEKSLQESTERYRSLFDSMLSGFALHEMIYDEAQRPADYRFLEVNAAFERITGLQAEDVLGKTMWQIMPEAKPEWIERYGVVALTGSPAHFVDYRSDLDRYYDVTAYCPRPGQFATIIEDITAGMRAHAVVELQARRSAALLEMPAAAERMAEADFIQWVQEQSENLTSSEISFVYRVHEDEQSIELITWSDRTVRDYCATAFERHYPIEDAGIWADAVRLRKPVVLNDYPAYPRKHGLPEDHAELTRLVCVPVVEGGKIVILAGVGNKPTEYTDLDVETLQLVANETWRIVRHHRAEDALRRSEEEYRTLTEQVPVIIYRATADETSTTTFISQAVRTLGYTPAEWLARPDVWIDSVHPDDRARLLTGLQALRQGKVFREEYRLKDRSGEWRHFRDEAVFERDPHDGTSYIQGVMIDITDRRRAQARTRQALNLAVRRREQLEGLLEASRAVQVHTDFESPARKIFGVAKGLLGATCGFVALRSEADDQTMPVFYDYGDSPSTDRVELPMPMLGPVRAVYETGKAILQNAGPNPDALPKGHVKLDALLLAPLSVDGVTVGILALGKEEGEFAEGDLELATAFGDIAAIAYKNAREMELRTKAEESLRLSERRYRELFDNPFTGVVVYGAVDGGDDFVLRDLNDTAERIAGATRQTVLGRRVTEVFPGIGSMGLLEVLRRVHESGEATHFPPALYEAPDGSSRWYENHVHRLPSGEVVALFEDVSTQRAAEIDLRESRERYALLFDTSNDALFVHTMHDDMPGVFVEVNEVACLRLGYSRDELLAMSPRDIDDPELDEDQQDAMRRLAAQGHVVFEIVQISKAGERLPVEISSRLFSYKGEIFALSIARDIAERKLAESARQALQAQLLQAQKMESVGRLAGGVAHDFNNMLSIILGYGESIFEGLHSGDPLREQVRQILEAAHRSAELTRQLLAFSRKQTLIPEVLSINAVVGNLERMLQRLIGEHIELQLSLSDDIGRVLVDPGQLEQVIMNLAINARDAMPDGGTLLIGTSAVDLDQAYADSHAGSAPGRYVLLSVADVGCGMTEEVVGRIFEPFFTTKETGKGTGLGLSTVYGIVKQSGGNIWVRSEPGRGSTFEVYFPQTEADERPAREKPEAAGRAEGGEHVLVVEDEEGLRRLMDTVLPRLGYEVTTAANGGEALLLMEEGGLQPDLIITDMVMPTMSGVELIDRLRKRHPGLRALYMSGYTDDTVVRRGVLDVNTPFIQKPFTIGDIAAKIRAVLDERTP